MIKITLAWLLLTVGITLGEEDPIERTVARLNSNSMWKNGAFADINLPENAMSFEIVRAAISPFSSNPFIHQRLLRKERDFRILEARDVIISDENPHFKALLYVSENQHFVLIYQRTNRNTWWARPYPIDK